jgi:hypothetical protein
MTNKSDNSNDRSTICNDSATTSHLRETILVKHMTTMHLSEALGALSLQNAPPQSQPAAAQSQPAATQSDVAPAANAAPAGSKGE